MKYQSIAMKSVCLLLISQLSACFDGNSDSKPEANVMLTSMSSVEGKTYQAGEPIELDYLTETSLLNTEHVGVSFILIEESKVGQLETEDEPDGYPLGEHYIPQLEDGEQSHNARLLLPNEELAVGDYVIAAYVDSSGVIETEASTEDNKSRGIEEGEVKTYATINIEEGYYHDFIIDKLKVGDGFVIFPGPGKRDTTGTGAPQEKVPDLIGFFNATKLGHTINAATVTAKIIIGDTSFDAHLWDEPEHKYSETMHIKFPDHEQSHFFPWDIALNGRLMKAIHDDFDRTGGENSFTLKFTIHDVSADVEHNLDNNEVTIEVPYALYHDDIKPKISDDAGLLPSAYKQVANASNVSPQMYTASSTSTFSKVGSWSATYGDSDVIAISPSFYSHMNMTSSNGGYAEALAEGDFDLYLFDKKVSLLSANAEGSANVSDGEISYDVGFSIMGSTLVNEGDTKSALDEGYGYSWSEEQKVVETTFTIVIVPVTVEAGVSGNLDLGVSLAYGSSRIDLGGDVVGANLDAYANAEINLGVASGGVGIDFLIIADTFNATVYADLSQAFNKSQITFGLEMNNDIEAISGDFYIYVKYPKYKWCCKIKTKTKTQTLYKTGSLYDKSWSILDVSSVFSY